MDTVREAARRSVLTEMGLGPEAAGKGMEFLRLKVRLNAVAGWTLKRCRNMLCGGICLPRLEGVLVFVPPTSPCPYTLPTTGL